MGNGPVVLMVLTSLLGCGATGDPPPDRAEPTRPSAPLSHGRDDEPRSDPEPESEVAADLDVLCRALDHDYDDGTLSDYYAKVTMKTEWGRERVREGEESITPGRLLQKAASELSARSGSRPETSSRSGSRPPMAVSLDSPELAGCRKLFDVLDELE